MDSPETPQPATAPAGTDTPDRLQHHPTVDDEKDFYSRIIQNIAAPLFVIDSNHTVLFWNNAMAKLTGKSSFQIKKTKLHWTPFHPVKHPTLADLVLDNNFEAIHEAYAEVEPSQIMQGACRAEGWFDAVGGKRRYLLLEASPIINSRNEIVAAVETVKDITDRKLAQEVLDNQNRFLQEILEAIPNPVFYKDTRRAYIGCNKAFSAFFGITVQEVLGKTLAEIVTPEFAQTSIKRDHEIIASRTPMTYETDLARNDGQVRTVLVTKAPFSDVNGELGGIVGTFVDVTEQRQLDDQIKKLSLAVEQSPATIVITDLHGCIEYVNSKFCKTTGYEREEAIGKNPSVLKSGEMPVEYYSELWKTITAGNEWRGEFHNKRKNGELYWEYATISPLTDKDGRITGFLAVKEDITSRKATETALSKSQKDLEAKHQELELVFSQVNIAKREWEKTLDSLRDLVILTDDGHRVRRCNRMLCDMTGKTYTEVIDRDWRELFAEAGFDFITFNGSHGELIEKLTKRLYDLTIYTITDPDSDHVSGFVISLHDTTEIRSVTEELKRTSKELNEAQHAVFQQEKLASIGQLAAGVAHEINNPMGFISSNLSTLGKYLERITSFETALIEAVQEKGDAGIVTALADLRKKMKIDFILNDIRGLLEESHDGAERVRRIVQDLKSFSHVDAAECKPFSINECLDSTLNMARNEIKYVADVEKQYDADLPLLNCYPQQLNQVFMNLLVNAAHAIEGHGTITITTLRESDDIIVRLSDTGKGIAPENLTRIFEPFFTTKEVGKGTGLGLSISYDIIKKHGGTMTVESTVGSGTTFTIRLPLNHVFKESTNEP